MRPAVAARGRTGRKRLTPRSTQQAHSVARPSARRCRASRWCTAAAGMRISCGRRQSDAGACVACAPQLFDKLGALVEPFTDRPEIWRGGRSLFWMRAPSGEHSPLHHFAGGDLGSSGNGSSAPRPRRSAWRGGLPRPAPAVRGGDLPRVPDSKIEIQLGGSPADDRGQAARFEGETRITVP